MGRNLISWANTVFPRFIGRSFPKRWERVPGFWEKFQIDKKHFSNNTPIIMDLFGVILETVGQ
jgi:hypothetical protein